MDVIEGFYINFFQLFKSAQILKRFISYASLQPLDIPLSFIGLVIVSIANCSIISPYMEKPKTIR